MPKTGFQTFENEYDMNKLSLDKHLTSMAFIKNSFWNIFEFKCVVTFDFDYTDLLKRNFTHLQIKKEYF